MGLQLPWPPGHPSYLGKYTLNAKTTTDASTSGTVDEEARARGCRDEMWQSQEVCEASSVFPLDWGSSQPVPISIYGSKQDANSGKEVKCHMQLNYHVVCSQSQASRLL